MELQGLTAYPPKVEKTLRKRLPMETTGARLKAIRDRAGLTNDAVARALGIALSTYSSYESRKRGRKLLPVPFVKGLMRVLVGRGQPPITREELMELVGADVLDDQEEKIVRALRKLTPERRALLEKLIAGEVGENKS